MQLKDAVVIVTGSGSGIGQVIARTFAGEGAKVVCCGRREDRLRETVQGIEQQGGTALAVPTDVTSPEQTRELASRAKAEFGRIDVLFNNAGSFHAIGAVEEVDPDLWWQDVTVNLRGPMLCSRGVLPTMREQGSGIIIHMTGGSRIPGGTSYSCSKVAIPRLAELMAQEQEAMGTGVLVFAMGPGLVHTEMTEIQANTQPGKRWVGNVGERIRNGETRSPHDCAAKSVELIQYAQPALSGSRFGPDTDFEQQLREKQQA